jgi:purine-binding chemotaxis protein CheW
MPAPELSDGGDRLFDRAAKVEREGDVILLIDPKALLDRAEADLLRDLTAEQHAP